MQGVHVSELDKLSVSSKFGEIDYSASEIYTIRSEEDLPIDRIKYIISETVFMKRPIYAPNNEVRFAFQICNLGRPIAFPERDMLLPSRSILEIASSRA